MLLIHDRPLCVCVCLLCVSMCSSYPGTFFTARNESVLARLLHPLLKASNLNTKVVGYVRQTETDKQEMSSMDGEQGNH